MKSPKYQRLDLITEVAYSIDGPIDRFEVTPFRVIAWADGRRHSFRYSFSSPSGEAGEPVLGGGSWTIEPVGPTFGQKPGWLGRLRRLWRNG